MGGLIACAGAQMLCSFGAAPSVLAVLPQKKVLTGAPAATIMDMQPITNIPPFGMCSSISNPTVSAATTAALGVLTPMPCVPSIPAPWTPGSTTVLVGNTPALNMTCKLTCAYGGMIQLLSAGQTKTTVGN